MSRVFCLRQCLLQCSFAQSTIEGKSLSSVINTSPSPGYTHTHTEGSAFTPVSYYCITATLNYIYSLVSCRIAELLLVFSWLCSMPGGVVTTRWRSRACVTVSKFMPDHASVSPLITTGRVIPMAAVSTLLELLVPLVLAAGGGDNS